MSYLRSLDINTIITHPLNPLRVINKNVLREFARIMTFYQVAYCNNIILRNKRDNSCVFVLNYLFQNVLELVCLISKVDFSQLIHRNFGKFLFVEILPGHIYTIIPFQHELTSKKIFNYYSIAENFIKKVF